MIAAVGCVAACGAAVGDDIRVREIWVPEEEFLRRSEADPDGIVMDLEEYRRLVLKGLEPRARKKLPELPPIDAIVAAARHTGRLDDRTVRVVSKLEVIVTRDGWVRCPLAPVPASLGRVLVDGKPGWLVLPAGSSGPQPKKKAAHRRFPLRYTVKNGDSWWKITAAFWGKDQGKLWEQVAAANGHRVLQPGARLIIPPPPGYVPGPDESFLLLRGKGRHEVNLEFSLAAKEVDERLTLAGAVPRAETASLSIDVPGRAEATSQPNVIETSYLEASDSSRLQVALGAASRFELSWRLKRTLGESDALVLAQHTMTVLPRRDDPLFVQQTKVTISRRKTDTVELDESAGTRVVDVTGDQVHSWERRDGRVVVLLNEPTIGDLTLRLGGILLGKDVEVDGETARRYAISVPSLRGAYSNRGWVTVDVPTPDRVDAVPLAGLTEVALGEAGGVAIQSFAPTRAWSFTASGAQLQLTTRSAEADFESRAACLARILESAVTLEAAYQVRMLAGRRYRFRMTLPEPWTLVSLAGTAGGKQAALRHEIVDVAGGGEAIDIELAKAVSVAVPLELRLTLNHGEYAPDVHWKSRLLGFSVPSLVGATRSRVDLGVSLPESMVAVVPEQTGWTASSREELATVGLDDQGLVAGLSSTRERDNIASAPVELELHHRLPQGEYQALTWLLVLEKRRLRVRTDLRIAVVDRAVDEIALRLPVGEDVQVHVLGDGVKEVPTSAAAVGSLHTVRYGKPWIGTRELRVEYEILETDLPRIGADRARVPWIEIDETPGDDPAAGQTPPVARSFNGERVIVFQSHGPVTVDVVPGHELESMRLDDLPELGAPQKGGRQLFAYRFFARSGTALPDGKSEATFKSTEFDTADSLDCIVRELEITTVLGESGVSRTRAEILVAYGKLQSIGIELPTDALLSARVDDEPALHIRKPDAERPFWRMPLPPSRSYARVVLVWQRGEGDGLSGWGSWDENAPRFKVEAKGEGAPANAAGDEAAAAGGSASQYVDVPVLSTRWKVHHPTGYRFWLDDGNLVSSTPDAEKRPRSFLSGFLNALLRGETPFVSVLSGPARERPLVALPAFAFERIEAQSAPSNAGQAMQQLEQRPTAQAPQQAAQVAQQVPQNLQNPQAVKPQDADKDRDSLELSALPEGLLVAAGKIGGDARMELIYQRWGWQRFAARAVFVLTLCSGAWLAFRTRRRLFWAVVGEGLVGLALLSDVLSWMIGWESPFLLMPMCEALFLLVLIGGAGELVGFLIARRERKRSAAAVASAAALIVLATIVGTGLCADEPPKAEAPVLIPFKTEDLRQLDDIPRKVYVPYETFRALWLRANPQERETRDDPPVDLVIGGAEYTLNIDGKAYTLVGTLSLDVLTDDWVSVPLPFERSQLERITVDGKELGVSQSKNGTPFFTLQGKGVHGLRLELRGKVETLPGTFGLRSSLLSAAATRVVATLPAGARIKAPSAPGGATTVSNDDSTTVTLDLGARAPLHLTWSFPRVETERAAQVSSVSYSELTLALDGYDVRRRERVEVSGGAVDALAFRVLADWRILAVRSAELTEWTVEDETDGRVLRLYFADPMRSADVEIHGWSPLGNTAEGVATQIAALALSGAIQQESFFGVRHGTTRRWHTDILSERRAAAAAEAKLVATFRLAADRLPDRIYHFYNSGDGQAVGASALAGSVDLTTDAVLVITRRESTVSARTRYRVVGPGPLRQEVTLPTSWQVRTVAGAAVRDWHVADGGGGRQRLIVELRDRARSGTEIIWSAERRYTALPVPVSVPFVRTMTVEPAARAEKVTWAVASSEDLDVGEARASGLERLAIDRAPRWVALPPRTQYRFAMRSTGLVPAYDLAIRTSTPESRASAQVVSLARTAEDFVQINSHVVLRVRGGGEDTFRFRLPPGADNISVRTRNQRSRLLSDNGEIVLTLISPVVGEQVVDLSYRLPRADDTTAVVLRPFEILSGGQRVTDVETYLGVLATEHSETTTENENGLDPVGADKLPYLPDGVAVESLQHMYRSTRASWSIGLRPQPLREAETAAAQVDLAELTTVVGGDGTLRTKALYTIRNRDLQFLQVDLPADAKLWGVTLGGKPVETSQSNGTLQIPLEHVGFGDLNLEVALAYEQPRFDMPSLSGSMDLEAPRLSSAGDGGAREEIAVTSTLWKVELPGGYSASLSDGNMQEVMSSVQLANKVESLLEQGERITGALSDRRTTQRQRDRLETNLKQIQQALSDNVIGLTNSLEVDEQGQRFRQIDQKQLEEQQGYSVDLLEKGRIGQQKLDSALKGSQSRAAAGKNARDQAFDDNRNFLGNGWYFNKKAVDAQVDEAPQGKGGSKRRGKQPSRRAPSAPPGQVPYRGLFEKGPFGGLDAARAVSVETAVETAAANAVQAAGLEPLEASRVQYVNPALETPPTDTDRASLTFRRLGGGAQLSIRLTTDRLWPRAVTLVALLAVLAFFGRRVFLARQS